MDHVEARHHAERILRHLTVAEGLRAAGADDSGEMAEARRHLERLANDFGCFLDPIDITARAAVEGRPVAAE